MEDKFIIMVLLVSIGLALLTVFIFAIIADKKDQFKDIKIAYHVAQNRIASQKQIVIAQIKQNILDKKYPSWEKASADLTFIFADETNHLRLLYPELTDIDICVLQLLAIGLDNHDILDFMDMSKRTFYKRRQLIAGRVGLLASQLNQFAYANIK